MADLPASMTSIDASKPKEAQSAMAQVYNKVADAFTNTAAKLQSTPPPTFDKGEEVASKFVQALGQAGPAFKDAASKISSADVSDPESLSKAIQEASTSLSSSMEGLNLMKGYELDPKTKQAVQELPACKALAASG